MAVNRQLDSTVRDPEPLLQVWDHGAAVMDTSAVPKDVKDQSLVTDAAGLDHLPGDMAFARAVKSDRAALRVVVRGDVASVTGTSTTAGEYRGRQANSAGAELVVLTRTPQGWRISAVHWSSRTRRAAGA